MHAEVTQGIDELKRQFAPSEVTVREDGQGGAYVIVERVAIGSKFNPSQTWMGAHIPAQYPYADIYPVFVASDVSRVDGIGFSPPITPNANFEGRAALQISRKNNALGASAQTAVAKFLKITDFLSRV